VRPFAGQSLKDLFTFSPRRVYIGAMLLLLTAASLAGSTPEPAVRATPVRQARAIVVIVKASRVGDRLPVPEDSVKRVSDVRDRDGSLHRLPLIEFY